MKISILTLFPEMFTSPFDYSIIKRARENDLVHINPINIRDFAVDRYKTVDDKPYGGGKGMIMRVDILHKAIQSVIGSQTSNNNSRHSGLPRIPTAQRKDSGRVHGFVGTCQNDSLQLKTVLLDPKGATFTQKKAQEFAQLDHLILVCGHYEGVDARMKQFVDETISIGDYVLTGGEIPAMAVIDSTTRLIPGVLDTKATNHESFSLRPDKKSTGAFLEYPQYTRPQTYKGLEVPEVLLSGNHKEIELWKKKHTMQKKK